MSTTTHTITFDLETGDTFALLVNSLSAYADVLGRQSAEQRAWGQDQYATDLEGTAAEARAMVEAVLAAGIDERDVESPPA